MTLVRLKHAFKHRYHTGDVSARPRFLDGVKYEMDPRIVVYRDQKILKLGGHMWQSCVFAMVITTQNRKSLHNPVGVAGWECSRCNTQTTDNPVHVLWLRNDCDNAIATKIHDS